MELHNDYCFWCESPISRPNVVLRWVDEDSMTRCLFHPANWLSKTMTSTNENANHQTIEEIAELVVREHYRVKAQQSKQPLRAVDDDVVLLAKNAQRTSRMAAENVLPRTGTLRRQVHDLVNEVGYSGITDEELELRLGGKHQSISACRRSLVIDGYLVDSGRTRKNRTGNECIIWIHKDAEMPEVLFNNV